MSDADTLLAFMNEREVDPATGNADGPYVRRQGDQFARNLNVAAAEIGWTPEQLSLGMQALVADGRVIAAHPSGDPTKIAGSSWLIVGDDQDAPELGELGVKQLRALAKDRGVDIKGLKAKDDIVAALQAAPEPESSEDAPELGEKSVDELIQFAGENEIELPEGDLEQADLVEYITEALAEKASA